MSFFFWIPSFTARLLAGLAATLSLLLSASYSYAENAADFVAVPPLINVSASGDKPNVLVVLDNSNSMDEAPTGRAVGSANSGSKSEIARTAVKAIVNNFGDRTRIGLMVYKQSGISKRYLHDSQYDASFNPNNYDATFTGDRASVTKRNRVSNPTNSGAYIYYNIALPFYSSSNLGNAFCYSSTADFDNGSETASGPWDNYDCYQRKTNTSDSGAAGFSQYLFSSRFVASDSDFAQNILDFGTYLTWQYVSLSWFSNSSPGQGMLHVAIDDVDAAHKTRLLNKLNTSQFSSSSDTPLRNAGLTPLAGTLESASKYFGGTLSNGEAASGVSTLAPTPNFCGTQDYVVLVTDGLPSVNKSGSKTTDVTSAVDAVADEAAALLSQGVRTYVVGFGLPTGVDKSLLNKIAIAGGTKATLFANDSTTLDAALGSIFLNIFNRSSSSSAASVLANNARGEGAVFQALYSPSIEDAAGAEVTWTGSLFGLFIDRFGLLREDTNQNAQLDGYDVDRVAIYSYNVVDDKTEVELFLSGDSLTPPDTSTGTPVETVRLEDLKSLWRAQDQLSAISDPVTQRVYSANASTGRYILSSIDGKNTLGFTALLSTDLAGLVAAEQAAKSDLDTAQSEYDVAQAQAGAASDSVLLKQAELDRLKSEGASAADVSEAEDQLALAKEDRVTAFDALNNKLTALNSAKIVYRTAFDDTFLNYLDTGSGELSNKVVRFIRGEEGIAGFRNRTIDLDGDGSSEVRRLGDIVNSTPALVAKPSSNYDVLHQDSTYAEFRAQYKDRRNVVYVGANDGMLHAFNAGFWNDSARSFETTNSFADATTTVAHPLGSELWSYIPKAALPHLQWLTNPSYAHTYYVDGQPLTFDANVFPDDATHPNGWGTVLVVGMRLGGGTTQVDSNADGTDDQTLRSTYIVMDVTDPEQPPELMAEISHPDLGFTTSVPALFKQRVQGTSYESPAVNNWYLAFGSGPTDIEKVVSEQQAKIFVYDLEARSFLGGYPKTLGGGYSNSFVGDIGVVDWEDNYVDNTAYFGVISGDPAATSTGSVERLRLDLTGLTTTSTLIDTNRPVVARPYLTKDSQGRRWVYFGTGRLFAAEDNVTTEQNRYFGIYEPVASGTETDATVTTGELKNVTGIEVRDTGAISESGLAVMMPDGAIVDNFNQLKYELPRQRLGWYRDLKKDGSDPTGRNLSSSDSVRSVLFFTEYTPSALSCKPEGTSRLFGIDFQAGVAPPFEVFSPQDSSKVADDEVASPYIDLGQGLASGPTAVSNDAASKLGNSSDSIVTIVTQSSTGQLQLTDAKVGSTSSSRQSWREVNLQ
jgi:hypothetical protein